MSSPRCCQVVPPRSLPSIYHIIRFIVPAMPPKRQRTSGLSETETIIAAKGLEDLIAKTREEHALRTEEIPEEELAKLERLEGVLQMLNSNRDAPQVLAAQPIHGSI